MLERLRKGLRIIALRSLNDPAAADDVVQETLLRGFEALRDGRLEDPERLGVYFRGICRHVIVDTLQARGRTTSLDALGHRPAANPSSTDALQSLIEDERRQRIARALDRLSPKARECVRMSFYDGLKPAEIARRLGEPGPRVRKRLSRAVQRLREVFLEQADICMSRSTGSPDVSIRRPRTER